MFEEYEVNTEGVDPLYAHSPEFIDALVNGTSAYPGTDDKIAVLMARYASGLPLWNSNDATRPTNSDAAIHREVAPFGWLVLSATDELSEAQEDPCDD